MAATTSLHTERCCHLVNAHAAASVRRLCSSVRQFLIYSTFVLCVVHIKAVLKSNVVSGC